MILLIKTKFNWILDIQFTATVKMQIWWHLKKAFLRKQIQRDKVNQETYEAKLKKCKHTNRQIFKNLPYSKQFTELEMMWIAEWSKSSLGSWSGPGGREF